MLTDSTTPVCYCYDHSVEQINRNSVAQKWLRCVCGLAESHMVWARLLHILFGWDTSVLWIFHPPPGTRGLDGDVLLWWWQKSQRARSITQGLLSPGLRANTLFLPLHSMAKESNMDKPKSRCGGTYSVPLGGGTSKSLGKGHGFRQSEKLRPVMQFTMRISQKVPLRLCICSCLGWAAKTERRGLFLFFAFFWITTVIPLVMENAFFNPPSPVGTWSEE